MSTTLNGRVLVGGNASGELIIIRKPISFLGMVNPVNGQLKSSVDNQKGISLAGKILWLPYTTGSTVGAYIIYQMSKNNVAPIAILAQTADTTLASGCALSNILLVDLIDLNKIPKDSNFASVNGNNGAVTFKTIASINNP
ncbi:MAG: DUF126 domain-containing protein [Nitrososphaerota archaeon]|jgi:predicted aconitase with swiveling domain|nr:DUF126 domain-containing protein [Nitrososphaerota archaeon]MDG7041096.1 DUF126 domain-containing protein [Nitrososphaerota archaeon]MDG7042984.1 DUF126 domain-containing protein [Nitrososphaerota archaeon]MDG7047949.1 DUF126 domain-containing protein [Nitrososphaerota archaeon]